MRALSAIVVMACLTVTDRSARASEPPIAARPGPVVWKKEWRRFTPIEGAVTLAGTLAGFLIETRLDDPSKPRLPGAIPIVDDGARYLLRGRTPHVRYVFASFSDIGFRMMVFFPYVDALFGGLVLHQSVDVTAQMALIDAEALTLSGITQLLISRGLSRERPYVQDCDDATPDRRGCSVSGDYKSFYGGHSAATFTSAALTCLHHQNLPLYGGGAPDAWACTWAVGVASATALFRIVSDSHYLSDVAVGAAAGWFYGYIMPRFLHYTPRTKARLGGFEPTFVPALGGGMLTLRRAL